jgi:mono/diheme cytochrome c family protein
MSTSPPPAASAAPEPPAERRRSWGVLRGIVVLLVAVVLVVVFAQIFTGCLIPFPTDMDRQPSFGFVEPPRLEAPGEAVAFGEPQEVASLGAPVNPVTLSDESRMRGEQLYALYCTLCHGLPGSGEPGGVGELFEPPAPDVGASAERLSDGQMFDIVSRGLGRMPPLAGRMGPLERWDVVNYLRSFSPHEEPPAAPRQNAARNYSIQCAQCHGSGGEGALGTPLHPSSFLTEGSIDEIARFINVGRRQRGMPPFAGRMAEEEVRQLSQLLKDLQAEPGLLQQAQDEIDTEEIEPPAEPPETTTTTSPPDGDEAATETEQELLALGARVYDADCLGCHGEEGAGGVGPPLVANEFVASASEAEVRQVVEQGRPGTAMPPFEGRLSDEEVDAVVALMESWAESPPQGMTDITGEEEELPFTHRAHVDRGMQCLFCHSGARRGPSADLPSLELCAICHRAITTQTEDTERVVAAFDEERTVSWPRVYRQPGFVYFSHRPHVVVAGVACSRCHGDVGSMTLARRARDMTMGFCLDCHQAIDYVYRDEGEPVDTEGRVVRQVGPFAGRFLADCHICHK